MDRTSIRWVTGPCAICGVCSTIETKSQSRTQRRIAQAIRASVKGDGIYSSRVCDSCIPKISFETEHLDQSSGPSEINVFEASNPGLQFRRAYGNPGSFGKRVGSCRDLKFTGDVPRSRSAPPVSGQSSTMSLNRKPSLSSIGRSESTVLRGGTEKRSRTITTAELPIMIGDIMTAATPDTGSDLNIMSALTAHRLGLCVDPDGEQATFRLANGDQTRAMGKTKACCSFPGEEGILSDVEFHVFSRLAVPLIIGRLFLDITETLTKNTHRLKMAVKTFDSSPRVLHLNTPRRTLQCYLDDQLVFANTDTGAEMNLVSEEFVRRCGISLQPPDDEHSEITLADERQAAITGMFEARFNTWEKPCPQNLRPRPHHKTFYVLKGLTTDVLLGEDLLYEISAFIEQRDAFLQRSDSFEALVYNNLNLITWLRRRLRNKRHRHLDQPDPKMAFHAELDAADAREQFRRAEAEAYIKGLPAEQRAFAEAEEEQIQWSYDTRRDINIRYYEQQISVVPP